MMGSVINLRKIQNHLGYRPLALFQGLYYIDYIN